MYTSPMVKFVKAFLAGVAIAGVANAMIDANLFPLKMLWRVNYLAVETSLDMLKGVMQQIDRERKLSETDTEDSDDESET